MLVVLEVVADVMLVLVMLVLVMLVLVMLADVTNVLLLAMIARRPATSVLLLPVMIVPQLVAMNVPRNAVVVHRKALRLAPTVEDQNEPPQTPLTPDESLHQAMMITGRNLMVGCGTMMLRKSQRRLVLLRPRKISTMKILMMTMTL